MLGSQDVDLSSNPTLDSVNDAGKPSVLNFISNDAETAAGGFFDGLFLQNTATA